MEQVQGVNSTESVERGKGGPSSLTPASLSEIEFQVEASQPVSALMQKSSPYPPFICFKDSKSYLSTLSGQGMTLVSDSKEVYSRRPQGSMHHATEVVLLRGVYFVLDAPKKRILMKIGTVFDPSVFYRSNDIQSTVDWHQQLKAFPCGKALAVKINQKKMRVIEADEKMNQCRKLDIELDEVDGEKSRLQGFETLDDNHLVCITEKGDLVVLKVDLDGFGGFEEVGRCPLNPIHEEGRDENSFGVSVCPKEKYCLVFVYDYCSYGRASRMFVCQLKDHDNPSKGYNPVVSCSVDLWEYELHNAYNACFGRYFGKAVVGCGYSYDKTGLFTFLFVEGGKGTEPRLEVGFQPQEGSKKRTYSLARVGETVCGALTGGYLLRISFSLKG